MSIVMHPDTTFVGLDVHKDSISVGVLRPGEVSPDVDRIFHDEPSIRRLIGGFADPQLLRVCYEAGPTGYGHTDRKSGGNEGQTAATSATGETGPDLAFCLVSPAIRAFAW